MRHTNGNYYFGQPLYAHAGFPDEYVPRVITFLKRLYGEIERYSSSNPERGSIGNSNGLFHRPPAGPRRRARTGRQPGDGPPATEFGHLRLGSSLLPVIL